MKARWLSSESSEEESDRRLTNSGAEAVRRLGNWRLLAVQEIGETASQLTGVLQTGS